MKRSEALAGIRQAGYHNDNEKATNIIIVKGIGVAAGRKAFQDGKKMKERGEPCDCPECTKERKNHGK